MKRKSNPINQDQSTTTLNESSKENVPTETLTELNALKENNTKKLKTQDYFKPPTTQEIQELNAAGDLFKSNLFKLQVS
jgi:hypothetical protein